MYSIRFVDDMSQKDGKGTPSCWKYGAYATVHSAHLTKQKSLVANIRKAEDRGDRRTTEQAHAFAFVYYLFILCIVITPHCLHNCWGPTTPVISGSKVANTSAITNKTFARH